MTTAIVKLPAQTETTHAMQRHDSTPSLTWDQIRSMGEELYRSGLLPEHVRNGAQAAAIVLTGRELGMPPMRALRSLQVVKGKVVESADSQLARFKSDGGHATFRHDRCGFAGCKAVKGKDGLAEHLDEHHASILGRHPNGDEHVETWTIADAEKAGLTKPDRNGGPSMHVKFPKSMNRSRVITNFLKSIGWEGGVGAYDPEEAKAFTVVATAEDSGPVVVATKPAKYTPDAARKAKVEQLMDALEIKEARGAYYREVAGGAVPTNDDETDAAISELEARAAEYVARKQRDAAEPREPGSDG